ncbi:MAG: hypothetical protein ACRDJE_08595 [Dehalococcoidia bacterium]
MPEKTASELTEADLTDFARQLYDWTATLPEVQQTLLHRILARAAAADADDTAGYALNAYAQLTLNGTAILSLVRGAAGLNVALGDGSVRVAGIKDGTSNTLQ